MIRVGIIKDGKYEKIDGFTPIIVTTKSASPYSSLSSFVLKDEKERIMENLWQGSKVYREVPEIIQRYSRWNNTISWQHNQEIHVDKNGLINENYLRWRHKLFYNKYPVRYPAGFSNKGKVLYSLDENENGDIDMTPLTYIEARKKIYGKIYTKLVKKQPLFYQLKTRFNLGENLLLLDVDGPHQESLDYYRKEYQVGNDFIYKHSIIANEQNINILLNDPKHSFGHCFFLATALLG